MGNDVLNLQLDGSSMFQDESEHQTKFDTDAFDKQKDDIECEIQLLDEFRKKKLKNRSLSRKRLSIDN